jgi:excisionase family DNA binding protein
MTDKHKLLSTKEAAKILGVSERTVRRWIKAGRIKAVEKVGRGRGGVVWDVPEREIERLKMELERTKDTKDTTKDTKDTTKDTNDTTNDTNDTTNDIGDTTNDTANCQESVDTQGNARGDGGEYALSQKARLSAKLPTKKDNALSPEKALNEAVFEDGEWWISVEMTECIFCTHSTTIRRHIRSKKYRVKKFPARNRSGFKYMIALSSLPVDAQRRFFESKAYKEILTRQTKEEGLFMSMEDLRDKKTRAKVDAYMTHRKAQNKDSAVKNLAFKYGVSKATIYRWINDVESWEKNKCISRLG